ncbi:MAG: DNA polymerase III subunit delta, partial [Bacteroidota bacterium]
MSFAELLSSLKKREFKPFYFFDGDEPYFIDKLVNVIQHDILDEAEQEFNQSVFYGRDISPNDLLPVVKRFPMMSEYQV